MTDKIRHSISALVIAFCLLATAACLPQPLNRPWGLADLRWLGGLDAPTPATDIIAVYTRTSALTVDIRVDLLDINPGDHYNFKLSLWDNRNFIDEPLLINLSSTGEAHTSTGGDGKPAIWPRILQDYGMDTITISLNRFLIGERYTLDVSTYTTAPLALADAARDIRSDGQPPVGRAPVMLAFWDTFPADTPAQALRRWDGAHTGPLGGRHGLKYVLDGARQYNFPVALLDFKNPASLAALDYLDDTGQILVMAEHGLLILPDVAYAEPANISLEFSRRAASGFGLPLSLFVYTAASNLQSNYLAQFISLPDASHLARSGGTRLIPLPSAQAVEATEDGPSLDVRRALVKAGLSADPADLVALGGSLPNSTWGSADMVYPTLAWLAAHPWIQPLNADDLMAFPLTGAQPAPAASGSPVSPLLTALKAAPDNSVTQLAWQTYLTLTAPAADGGLQDLRSAYLGQVEELLAAARWAENPSIKADCSSDLDNDSLSDCILSNWTWFASLDPQGGRLTHLFFMDAAGPHQLIGPTSQFAIGLSDPSVWRPDLGEAADPSVIPGAFSDDTGAWDIDLFTASAGEVTFTSPDRERIKTYRLTKNGIEVTYRVPGLVITRVPLTVDPQRFYFGPTNYRPAIAPHAWIWSLVNGISVELQTDAKLSAQGFVSSFPFLSMSEDPNLDYPKGHYIPFPLSLVTIQGDKNFTVQIAVK